MRALPALLAAAWAWGGPAPETVSLRTADGWTLAARYARAGPGGAVVLLHGLGSGKEEWSGLEAALHRLGVSTLAVDLRGHGGSRKPGPTGSWEGLGPGAWTALWRDAEAGLDFLGRRGHGRAGLAGASLGANAALEAAGRLPRASFAALLSPGLDYQGLRADAALEAYGPRPLLLCASPGDAYAWGSARALLLSRERAGASVEWVPAPSGHGAPMLRDPRTLRRVASWIAARLRK